MNEQQALEKMIAPGTRRPGKYREGVVQIHVTRSCNMSCYNCTQGSNYGGKATFITPEQFEQAVLSLRGYFGVVGVFGGNPALHPQFDELCHIIAAYIPRNQRGIWCNHPVTVERARMMRETFDPSVSNLNVHLDQNAYALFKQGWPECHPVGLAQDSRHSPVYVAMRDVLKKECPNSDCQGYGGESDDDGNIIRICPTCQGTGYVYDEERAWELISDCDINKHWSAMIGVFRGELRAWFCEIAGAQAMLHQDDSCTSCGGKGSRSEQMAVEGGYANTTSERKTIGGPCSVCNGTGREYLDTGIDPTILYDKEYQTNPPNPKYKWWELGMIHFAHQVRKHCHECGVPLRGHGELAQTQSTFAKEQYSQTHADVCKPKRVGRLTEEVTELQQLGIGKLSRMTDYLGNSKR